MSDLAGLEADLAGLEHVFDDESLGYLIVSNKVTARNELGRFATQVGEAHARAIARAGRRGAQFMRDHVPKKTGKLAASVHWHMLGSRTGEITWGAGAPYWRYVAYGAREHEITGWVRFLWEKAGRMWEPGPNMIQHPGTRANPFITTTYHFTQLELEDAMREEYAHLR